MEKLNIAFFLGNDITSHLIMNYVLDKLMKKCNSFYLFLINKEMDPNSIKELKRLYIYERQLLNEYIYPFLDNKKYLPLFYKSPNQIKRYYMDKVYVESIPNVNDRKFINFLDTHNINVGISIRCYQKFGENIINYFENVNYHGTSFFVNLHPGLLPKYRGVTTFCRAMQNGEKKSGFTLHKINQKWDAGEIIMKKSSTIDYSLSVVENMCIQHVLASKIIVSNILKLITRENILSYPQNVTRAKYYSHPSLLDIKDFQKKKIKLVRRKQIINRMVEYFTFPKSSAHKELKELLLATSRRLEDRL